MERKKEYLDTEEKQRKMRSSRRKKIM